MTKRKEDSELAKALAVKGVRNRVRHHFSLQADIVLNEVLPEAESVFDDALQAGELLTPDEVIQRVLTPRKLGTGR